MVQAGKRLISIALKLSDENLGTWPHLTVKETGKYGPSLQIREQRISVENQSLLILHYNSVICNSTQSQRKGMYLLSSFKGPQPISKHEQLSLLDI